MSRERRRLLFRCLPGRRAVVTYIISGTVYDSDGSTPVSGATVALGALTTGSTVPQIRPVVVRNASSELKVIWMSGRFTTFANYYTYIKSDPQYG